MPSGWDERSRAILEAAELALARYRDAGRNPPVVDELRLATAQARSDLMPSEKVERVRAIMMSVPELEELMRAEFPKGALPPPFRGGFAAC
ncbi:hypothetical protein ACIPSJ_27320 [Streptomyces sp. NPDC090088]|uniref:hypothetical protein n=1 Tax=Streptomyces sp. NPDC090088 TaxID=3365944 RepID=UPI0037F22B10